MPTFAKSSALPLLAVARARRLSLSDWRLWVRVAGLRALLYAAHRSAHRLAPAA